MCVLIAIMLVDDDDGDDSDDGDDGFFSGW